MTIRVYLVEDHALMRETLTEFIDSHDDMHVCGQSESAERALDRLVDAAADLLLVDMSLPGMSGSEFVEIVAERWPELPCLMLSGHGEANYVQAALAAGARGYALKGRPQELPAAIREVAVGRGYLSDPLRP